MILEEISGDLSGRCDTGGRLSLPSGSSSETVRELQQVWNLEFQKVFRQHVDVVGVVISPILPTPPEHPHHQINHQFVNPLSPGTCRERQVKVTLSAPCQFISFHSKESRERNLLISSRESVWIDV
jgi:hypothetical protein